MGESKKTLAFKILEDTRAYIQKKEGGTVEVLQDEQRPNTAKISWYGFYTHEGVLTPLTCVMNIFLDDLKNFASPDDLGDWFIRQITEKIVQTGGTLAKTLEAADIEPVVSRVGAYVEKELGGKLSVTKNIFAGQVSYTLSWKNDKDGLSFKRAFTKESITEAGNPQLVAEIFVHNAVRKLRKEGWNA